ncbi:MAG: GIY-YIG nuclease family protein [Planctomycetota bacterium]
MTQKDRQPKAAADLYDPPLELWPTGGVYQLWVWVSARVWVRVGRLGRCEFSPGWYVYTGRAARGLVARVGRHVNGARRRHWHIDYLLARREVSIQRVVLASDDAEQECAINAAMGSEGDCVVPGFGSSDCRAGCAAHLWRRLHGVSRGTGWR